MAPKISAVPRSGCRENQARWDEHESQADHDGTERSRRAATVGQVLRERDDSRDFHELRRLDDDRAHFEPAAGAQVKVSDQQHHDECEHPGEIQRRRYSVQRAVVDLSHSERKPEANGAKESLLNSLVLQSGGAGIGGGAEHQNAKCHEGDGRNHGRPFDARQAEKHQSRRSGEMKSGRSCGSGGISPVMR